MRAEGLVSPRLVGRLLDRELGGSGGTDADSQTA